MARPSSKGAYAPLAAQYYLDDSILEVGAEAELLWVRILSFLASVASDGFITDRQVRSAAIGLRNVTRRIDALSSAGLLVSADGGYQIRSWSKWNRTADQIGRALAKDAERKRKKLHAIDSDLHADDSELHADDSDLHADDSDNVTRFKQNVHPSSGAPHESGHLGTNSVRIPDSFHTDSGLKSRAEQSSTEQYRTSTKAVLDSLFDEAWNGWPKKVDRSDARKRFETATRKVTPFELAATIRRFGDAYAATTDKQYTPALGAWLNRERWTDELPTGPANSGSTRGQENLAMVAKYAALENKQLGIES